MYVDFCETAGSDEEIQIQLEVSFRQIELECKWILCWSGHPLISCWSHTSVSPPVTAAVAVAIEIQPNWSSPTKFHHHRWKSFQEDSVLLSDNCFEKILPQWFAGFARRATWTVTGSKSRVNLFENVSNKSQEKLTFSWYYY